MRKKVGRGNWRGPLTQRFWAKVDKRGGDECWLWIGARDPRGYGHIKRNGKTVQAHRVAFEIATGTDPGDLSVHHLCETKNCVNPAHLELMDGAEHSRHHLVGHPLHRDGSHSKTKLTAEQVEEIRASPLSLSQLGKVYGVAPSTISAVRTGATWK